MKAKYETSMTFASVLVGIDYKEEHDGIYELLQSISGLSQGKKISAVKRYLKAHPEVKNIAFVLDIWREEDGTGS